MLVEEVRALKRVIEELSPQTATSAHTKFSELLGIGSARPTQPMPSGLLLASVQRQTKIAIATPTLDARGTSSHKPGNTEPPASPSGTGTGTGTLARRVTLTSIMSNLGRGLFKTGGEGSKAESGTATGAALSGGTAGSGDGEHSASTTTSKASELARFLDVVQYKKSSAEGQGEGEMGAASGRDNAFASIGAPSAPEGRRGSAQVVQGTLREAAVTSAYSEDNISIISLTFESLVSTLPPPLVHPVPHSHTQPSRH